MRVIRLFDEDHDRSRGDHDCPEDDRVPEIARRLERLEWPAAPPQLRERCWERFSATLSARRGP